MKKTLFVIDAYNLIYRMFYAIPEIHTREGMQVNAIFGVAKFLKNISEENPDAELIVATDTGKTFRQEIFSEYKGTRERMPDNLRSQIDGVFEIFEAANIQIVGKEWYEADDIMGSIAKQFPNDDLQVVIISSDKDLCQFVDDGRVHIYDAMKRKFMRRADVIEKFGVPPEQVCDYLAIVGDSSDNIPGIAGFGPKKTADLLKKYSSLDGIYENISELTPKMCEWLESGREMAYLSKKLASIITDLEIEKISIDNFSDNLLSEKYISILEKYEFKSLIPKNFQKIEKKSEIIQEEILDQVFFEKIIAKIKEKNNFIGLEIDGQNKIFVSFDGKIYEINPTKIDCFDFIADIFAGEIKIATYDAKTIFTKLDEIKNPSLLNNNQESLF